MGGGEGLGARLEVSWEAGKAWRQGERCHGRRGRPGDKARGVMGGGEGLGTRLEVSWEAAFLTFPPSSV